MSAIYMLYDKRKCAKDKAPLLITPDNSEVQGKLKQLMQECPQGHIAVTISLYDDEGGG